MRHELKILPEYFSAVYDGSKPFEIRKNDRDYKVGDTLLLKEWGPGFGYTGHYIERTVSYVFSDPEYVKEGYVILGLIH